MWLRILRWGDNLRLSSVQFSSVTQSCPTLCNPMNRSTPGLPGLPVHHHAAIAKSLQSCPTLCDPIDSLLPGSSFPGILHARVLEWGVIAFSNITLIIFYLMKVVSPCAQSLSHFQLIVTSCTIACQAPLSMGFSKQEYWSGVPSSSPTCVHYGLLNLVMIL